MTRLDKGHEVTLDSPTSKEVVVTTPHIPGLELHLQPGTTIKDHGGKTITSVSITAVPLDRPPFPLPLGVTAPLSFTIQPGGAYLSKPAQLIYPNYTHLPPGQRVPFWNYDPDKKGRHVYGQGTSPPMPSKSFPMTTVVGTWIISCGVSAALTRLRRRAAVSVAAISRRQK